MKKGITFSLILCLGLGVFAWQFWGDAIMQRGNPLPYLSAAVQLRDSQPFVEVHTKNSAEDVRVYLTKRGTCHEFLTFIEETHEVTFQEQFGAAYIFSDAGEVLRVSTEVYWGNYYVWEVPEK